MNNVIKSYNEDKVWESLLKSLQTSGVFNALSIGPFSDKMTYKNPSYFIYNGPKFANKM